MVCTCITVGIILVLITTGISATALRKRTPFSHGDTTPLGPLTNDFSDWLVANEYDDFDFPREDFNQIGSFGGKDTSDQKLTHRPIVFVHGNSDGALSDNSKWGTGWSSSIKHFMAKGYGRHELYATTWGDRVAANAYLRTHSCETIVRARTFFEAVILYTDADQIDVISHSMGVAIARKAIRGGIIDGDDGFCNIGPSLRSRIHTFIGISGANYGMCQCTGGNATAIYPTCSKKNGFWPGEPCYISPTTNALAVCGNLKSKCGQRSYAKLLQEMNEDPKNEASNVFSFWSYDDDLIGSNDSVFGRPTSFIPFSNASKVLRGVDHMSTKDGTFDLQYRLITTQSFLSKEEQELHSFDDLII
uniref:Lipase n=1 Tax=Panagrellus redivivus TaxID=6233 RepID=A0A7E4ZVA0_PANRE